MRVGVGLLLLFLFVLPAHAAEQEPAEPYVGKVLFTGNRAVSDEELSQVIMTTRERSFLGLGLFGKQRKPFSGEEFTKDLLLLKKLYTYKGYFFADIDTLLQRKKGGQRIDIDFRITENQPTTIDSLAYQGLAPSRLNSESGSFGNRNCTRATSSPLKGSLTNGTALWHSSGRKLRLFQ